MTMNYWELLRPKYVSPFFAGWYTTLGFLVFVVFLIIPFFIKWVLHLLVKKADTDPPRANWKKKPLLILVHWSLKPGRGIRGKKTAKQLLAGGLLGLNIVYLIAHGGIIRDPGVLVVGSLQNLGSEDFEFVRQFFYRWVALGWTLMVTSVALNLYSLEVGYRNLEAEHKKREREQAARAAEYKKREQAKSKLLFISVQKLRLPSGPNIRGIELIYPSQSSLLFPPGERWIDCNGALKLKLDSEKDPWLLQITYVEASGWIIKRSGKFPNTKTWVNDRPFKPDEEEILTDYYTVYWTDQTNTGSAGQFLCEVALK